MATMKAFITSTEGLVRLGFLIGIGLVMLSSLKNNSAMTTTANTTIDQIISGIATYGGWVGLIVLIVVGAYFFKNMNFGSK